MWKTLFYCRVLTLDFRQNKYAEKTSLQNSNLIMDLIGSSQRFFRKQRICMMGKLTDLAHLFCGSEIDSCDFAFYEECFQALNSSNSSKNIVITKPI